MLWFVYLQCMVNRKNGSWHPFWARNDGAYKFHKFMPMQGFPALPANMSRGMHEKNCTDKVHIQPIFILYCVYKLRGKVFFISCLTKGEVCPLIGFATCKLVSAQRNICFGHLRWVSLFTVGSTNPITCLNKIKNPRQVQICNLPTHKGGDKSAVFLTHSRHTTQTCC